MNRAKLSTKSRIVLVVIIIIENMMCHARATTERLINIKAGVYLSYKQLGTPGVQGIQSCAADVD